MTAQELRQKYLDFFVKKGHKVIPSAPLVPEEKVELAGTQRVLFTTAGMHPLIPYLLGESHPEGKRLVNVQKCLRTDDIDEVGDKVHHTFFEMLGNWSLGDYWKKEAIEWSYEFLTSKEWLGIDKNKLAVSVFAGDQDAPFDKESYDVWKKLGISDSRIARLPKKNNWWGPVGETGPCGPDTEMFIWGGKGQAPEKFDPEDPGWTLEVWNDVFMEYNKTAEGNFEPLAQKNVDTGMGLERMLAVLNGVDDDYQTEVFSDLYSNIKKAVEGELTDVRNKRIRIFLDHSRAAVFLIADGVIPGKNERESVLRRLIRRADDQLDILGLGLDVGLWWRSAIGHFRRVYSGVYEIKSNTLNIVEEELEKYRGVKSPQNIKFVSDRISLNEDRDKEIILIDLKKYLNQSDPRLFIESHGFSSLPSVAAGTVAFEAQSTLGFPASETFQIAAEKLGPKFKREEAEGVLNIFMSEHQKRSKISAEKKFAGGLADQSEQTVKYHTATHLLHAALRQILGTHVEQKGSNITGERLRFDFSHSQKMTEEEIRKVEDVVNEKIKDNLPVTMEEMDYEEAIKSGALAFFKERYGGKVKVYSIGSPSVPSGHSGFLFSREICGGPHVDFTGRLGKFTIKKEEAAGRGLRRIYAVLE